MTDPEAFTTAWYEAYVAKSPEVQGGEPVISGTRTPVRAVVELFRYVYPGDWNEVQRSLDHLNALRKLHVG